MDSRTSSAPAAEINKVVGRMGNSVSNLQADCKEHVIGDGLTGLGGGARVSSDNPPPTQDIATCLMEPSSCTDWTEHGRKPHHHADNTSGTPVRDSGDSGSVLPKIKCGHDATNFGLSQARLTSFLNDSVMRAESSCAELAEIFCNPPHITGLVNTLETRMPFEGEAYQHVAEQPDGSIVLELDVLVPCPRRLEYWPPATCLRI